MADTDVSIVTYNTNDDELLRCLSSLTAVDDIGHIHIIDNSSSPNTRQIAESFAPRVTYTPHANTGYGDSHNVAMKHSLENGAPFHLVINSDVYFSPGTLEECLRFMRANPKCAQLIPHTIYPDGTEQHVIHPLPTPLDMFMRAFLPKSMLKKRRERYNLTRRDPNAIINAPYHHGCFMLLRTDALRKTGLFDPRFFMYPEDIDLTRRIHRDYLTLYYPYATITHAHHAASRTSRKMRKIHILNMLKYFRKWGFFFDPERRRFNRQLLSQITTK